MAIEIGFFEDVDTDEKRARVYAEGPFVITNPLENGWRIEVEQKGCKAPVLPDLSIDRHFKSMGFEEPKFRNRQKAVDLCDWLNGEVRDGWITCHPDGTWRAFENTYRPAKPISSPSRTYVVICKTDDSDRPRHCCHKVELPARVEHTDLVTGEAYTAPLENTAWAAEWYFDHVNPTAGEVVICVSWEDYQNLKDRARQPE